MVCRLPAGCVLALDVRGRYNTYAWGGRKDVLLVTQVGAGDTAHHHASGISYTADSRGHTITCRAEMRSDVAAAHATPTHIASCAPIARVPRPPNPPLLSCAQSWYGQRDLVLPSALLGVSGMALAGAALLLVLAGRVRRAA